MAAFNLAVTFLVMLFPRGFAAFVWATTSWFDGAFGSRWLPALGMAFMPYSLLWFVTVRDIWSGAWAWPQSAILCLAVLADLACWTWLGETGD